MAPLRGEIRDPGDSRVGRGLSTHRLSRAVAPDDEREGLREDDRMVVIGAEAADALDEHLVDGAHGGGCGFKPPGADEIPPSFGLKALGEAARDHRRDTDEKIEHARVPNGTRVRVCVRFATVGGGWRACAVGCAGPVAS